MIIDRKDSRLVVICAQCGDHMRRVGVHLSTAVSSKSRVTYECDCGEMIIVEADNQITPVGSRHTERW